MIKSNFNKVIFILLFFLILYFTGILLFKKELGDYFLLIIRTYLENDKIYIFIIAISFLIGLFSMLYSLYSKSQKDLMLLFRIFGPVFDPIANSITYGIVISSVLKMFSGLYIQFFYEVEYFKDFGFLNITAIILACIPLLIWSINGLILLSKDIFNFSSKSDIKTEKFQE